MKMKSALALALLLVAALQSESAQQLRAVEAYASPERIYAGQEFDIRFDILLDKASDLNIAVPSGLPESIELGKPRGLGTTPADPGDPSKGVVIHAAMTAYSAQPVKVDPEASVIQIDLVERVQIMFGTSTRMVRRAARVDWKPFEILPLPEEGRPGGFSGAVGRFRLESRISRRALAVGDIADWTLALRGEGRLNGAALAAPAPDPALFRDYPAERPDAQDGTLAAVARRLVPLKPGEAEVPAATFTYFDPESGEYATAEAPAIAISVAERTAEAEDTVKTIDLAKPDAAVEAKQGAGIAQLHLAPARGALKTHLAAPDALETLEEPEGLGWRRVRDRRTGHTGWIETGR